jgi:tetratricopeptide (TPR) repeat protein
MSSQRNLVPWYKTYEDQNLHQQESQKLSTVIAQAEASFESGNYHKLVSLIEEALSENITDTNNLVILSCFLNEALCELSRYEEAANVISAYEKEVINNLPEKLQAELLLRIGATCSWLAQYPKAIAKLNEAIRLFTSLNDREGICRGYFELSRLYININEYTIAGDYLKRALNDAEQLNSTRLISQILLRLGMVSHFEGDFASAKMHYSKGLKLVESSHDYRLIGSLQMDLANTLFFEERGDAEQIISLYESAIGNFKILSNMDAITFC